MAYTTEQLNTLETAIAAGALTVRYSDGKSVTYHSLADMQRLRREMQAELGVAPAKKRVGIVSPITGHGF